MYMVTDYTSHGKTFLSDLQINLTARVRCIHYNDNNYQPDLGFQPRNFKTGQSRKNVTF